MENSGEQGPSKKKSKGRRKIEIKKIEKLSSRQVTFSKRRKGIFNKAAELSLLTGAEVAVIVQSHGNKLFTFGHRDVDSVVGRFIYGGGDSVDCKPEMMAAAEEERCWWDADVSGMELEELERYAAAMDELMTNADNLLVDRVWEGCIGQDDGLPVADDLLLDRVWEGQDDGLPVADNVLLDRVWEGCIGQDDGLPVADNLLLDRVWEDCIGQDDGLPVTDDLLLDLDRVWEGQDDGLPDLLLDCVREGQDNGLPVADDLLLDGVLGWEDDEFPVWL